MFSEERFASVEQAKIVTNVYRAHGDLPRNILRALALKEALAKIEIRITEGERIVGNRTTGVRAGVIFPESGLSWVDREIESLPTRPQDPFAIRQEDVKAFHEDIFPFWKGRTLEDILDERIGDGYYFSKTIRLLKKLLTEPALLDIPAKEALNIEY